MLHLKLHHTIPDEDPDRAPGASAFVLSNISQFLEQFFRGTESKILIWFLHINRLNPLWSLRGGQKERGEMLSHTGKEGPGRGKRI